MRTTIPTLNIHSKSREDIIILHYYKDGPNDQMDPKRRSLFVVRFGTRSVPLIVPEFTNWSVRAIPSDQIGMAENIVREATLTDVPEMAEVFAVGFIDDDLFGRLLHPKRHEHPDDWIRHWRRDMRNHVLDPRGKCFVRTDARGMVMGCIIMRRLGGGGDSLAAAETDAHLAQRKLYAAQDQTESLTDRSADPKAIELFNQNWDDIKHYFSGPREDCWIIELLCIHPETQAKGFGRALIENAINLCKSEQPPVPLAVIASEVGDGFYEKIGFREVGRADVGGLSGIRGGSLKFYEQHLK